MLGDELTNFNQQILNFFLADLSSSLIKVIKLSTYKVASISCWKEVKLHQLFPDTYQLTFCLNHAFKQILPVSILSKLKTSRRCSFKYGKLP